MTTVGASSSTRENPGNSCGISFRRVLFPTMPLSMTRTPASSAWSTSPIRASVHEENCGKLAAHAGAKSARAGSAPQRGSTDAFRWFRALSLHLNP